MDEHLENKVIHVIMLLSRIIYCCTAISKPRLVGDFVQNVNTDISVFADSSLLNATWQLANGICCSVEVYLKGLINIPTSPNYVHVVDVSRSFTPKRQTCQILPVPHRKSYLMSVRSACLGDNVYRC